MSKQATLQDAFLNLLRKESIPVTIYLINGVQLKGVVRGFDSFTVLLENDGRQLLIYKHALSTVSPSRPVGQALAEARREAPEVEQAAETPLPAAPATE